MVNYAKAEDTYALGETEELLASDVSAPPSEGDVEAFWTNRSTQCDVIKRMFDLNALPCSYDYISYDTQCLANARMPISPNLQEVYLSNVLYAEYSVGGVWSNSLANVFKIVPQSFGVWPNIDNVTYCFQPNKLTTLDASFGSVELDQAIQQTFELSLKTISISGLNELKTLNMNYADL